MICVHFLGARISFAVKHLCCQPANIQMPKCIMFVLCTLNCSYHINLSSLYRFYYVHTHMKSKKNNLIYPLLRLYISRFIYLFLCVFRFFLSWSFILTEKSTKLLCELRFGFVWIQNYNATAVVWCTKHRDISKIMWSEVRKKKYAEINF